MSSDKKRTVSPLKPRLESSPLAGLEFIREPIKPLPTVVKSGLSAQVKTSSEGDNPFAKDYSFVCGKGVPNPMNLKIFFPSSQTPREALAVIVKRDATVEQVIGYALYCYSEEKRKPALDAKSKLDKVAYWNLRIVEDDGTIDNDFPGIFCK
jgi:hypothetical protein